MSCSSESSPDATDDVPKVWLRTNRRVLMMAMILPGLIVAVAGGLAWRTADGDWIRYVWLALALAGGISIALLLRECRRPRVGFADNHLLLYLRAGQPYRLPLEVAEFFFLGATDANVPGPEGSGGKISALVVRLAERATDWHERPVKDSLGRWDQGYVRVHGAWCERLCAGTISRLNGHLRRAQRAAKETAAEQAE